MARELIDNKDKKLIEQWLENDKVTVFKAGAITENIEYTFGSKKKKAPAKNAK